jgi:cell filamentation protein
VEITELAQRMFGRLEQMHWFCALDRAAYVQNMTEFYSSLNYLHPFREGNGRTQRLFFRQLAKQSGYHLDFSGVDRDRMMIATIHAASGIEDDLRQIFEELLIPL